MRKEWEWRAKRRIKKTRGRMEKWRLRSKRRGMMEEKDKKGRRRWRQKKGAYKR